METLAALRIKTGNPKEHDAVGDRFVPLVELVRRLDPTRPWISGDGDSDWGGRFPVALAHYGPDVEHYRVQERTGKPWGVTESTYLWGSMPSEVSQWNGERAYESWQGRLEGMALDVWNELAVKQIEPFPKISAVWVYDVTYYGCWPQPLGLRDLTRAPTIEDGVQFTAPFVEGRPGIQPERLGPYATMLNPGYDPSLPLYQPSPVFDAARDAYAASRPAQFSRRLFEYPDEPIKAGPPPSLANDGTINRVAFLGEPASPLFQTFDQAGVPWVAADAAAPVLVVDMGSVRDAARTNLARIEQTLQAGGTVLVWGVTVQNMASANALLSLPVRAVARSGSSLLPAKDHPLAAALPPSRCYFSEASAGQIVMKYGLEGPLVTQGQIVLRAADINWQIWRDRFEPLKVAAAIRSEREAKPSGAALVEHRVATGRLFVLCGSNPLIRPKSRRTSRAQSPITSPLGATRRPRPASRRSEQGHRRVFVSRKRTSRPSWRSRRTRG